MLGTLALEKIQGEDFRWMQGWLYESSAIVLEDSRKFVAEKRLHPLLWKYQVPSFGALFGKIRTGYAPEVHADAIEVLTANETWFFRDPIHFEALKQKAIPTLLKARERSKTLRIWSAGCSSGQEAYSLAMMLSEMPALNGWKIWLLGTDLSYRQIQKARAGLYNRDEISRGLPAAQLNRHFKQQGMQWSASPELRACVEFQVLRLDQDWVTMPDFDLVLMRNVLYHFDQFNRTRILEKVREQMRPDGLLMMGSLEKNDLEEGFKMEGEERFAFHRKVELVRERQAA